jgi:hypothetical protein
LPFDGRRLVFLTSFSYSHSLTTSFPFFYNQQTTKERERERGVVSKLSQVGPNLSPMKVMEMEVLWIYGRRSVTVYQTGKGKIEQ